MNCDHAYMLYNGKNIRETDLYDLEAELSIIPIDKETGKRIEKPSITEVVDRRKNLADHYKYCPYCGEKLNWKKFREMAQSEVDKWLPI